MSRVFIGWERNSLAFSLAKHIKRRNLFVANGDNNYLNKLRQKKRDKLCNHVINFNEFASKNFYHLNKLFLCAFSSFVTRKRNVIV